MNEIAPDTLTVLPDPLLFRIARWTQRLCICVAVIAVLWGMTPLFVAGGSSPAAATSRGILPILVTTLLCGLSMLLSEPDRNGAVVSFMRLSANILAVFAAAIVIFWARAASAATDPTHITHPAVRLTISIVVLTLIVVLVENKNWLINRSVDVLVFSLCLLVLMLISDAIFGMFALFGRAASNRLPLSALVCLVALTAAVSLRQAEHGVFSIFLGVGIGSRLARVFAPIFVLLPFAWQVTNTWIESQGTTGHLSAALLASSAVAIAFGVLLFFAWRISNMESEIHELILRDDATRLYNHRGFHLLAEHALRLAQRSNVPFSVLFIDFESLAQIHSQLGPNAAAASLAEAGEILRATFRESDIKGRIGGDEFAVAGRFDRAGISIATLRLEAATAARSAKSGRPIPLKFSMGHVTTSDADTQESLKDLLARAGQLRNRQDGQLKEMLVN